MKQPGRNGAPEFPQSRASLALKQVLQQKDRETKFLEPARHVTSGNFSHQEAGGRNYWSGFGMNPTKVFTGHSPGSRSRISRPVSRHLIHDLPSTCGLFARGHLCWQPVQPVTRLVDSAILMMSVQFG